MPITSYLAHPHIGKKKELIQNLSLVSNCEIIPAENKEVLILVTETNDKNEEEVLKKKIESISSLKLLAMVSGFNS